MRSFFPLAMLACCPACMHAVAPETGGNAPQTHSLKNEHALLTVDRTGRVVEFGTGEARFAADGTLPIMQVLYSESPTMWEARSWQTLPPDGVTVVQKGDRLTVRGETFGGKRISIELEIALKGNEFTCEATAHNFEPGTLVGVQAPLMGGFNDLPGGTLYYPDRSGKKLPAPFKATKKQVYELGYPVPLSAQFMTFSTGSAGWGVFCLDKHMLWKSIGVGGESAQLGVTQYCFLESGKRGTLPPVALKAYAGTWHVAADRYREWFNTWRHVHKVSPVLAKMPAFSSVIIKARPKDDPAMRDVMKANEVGTYRNAVPRISDIAQRGYQGVEIIGWHGLGHDSLYPEHNVSDAMGGKAEMKAMAASAKQQGLMLGYYTNARLGDETNPFFKEHHDWAVRQREGQDWHEYYGGGFFTMICPHSEGFINLMRDTTVKLVGEYHADFLQFDQVGAAGSTLCFEKSHGHRTPASAWAEGYAKMLETCIDAGRRINPSFWIWVEGSWELAGQYIDLQQGGYWKDNIGDLRCGEVYRYTFPDHYQMGGASMGGIPFWRGGRDIPYLQAHAEFYAKARFMDTVGLQFPADNFEARWLMTDREIMITAQHRERAEVSGAVTLVLPPELARLSVASAETLSGTPAADLRIENGVVTATFTVPPRGVEGINLKFR